MAVAVHVSELGGHMAVVSSKNLFRESALPVAEQGLHATEVAGGYDVREPVAVDIPRGEGGVADIGPGGRERAEATFTVAEPDVERRVGEPGRRDQIEMAVPIDIDKEGLKPPLFSLSQGEDQRIGGKSRRGSGHSGAARYDPYGC